MSDPVCYLDMDGVLVDFVTGAHKLHGKMPFRMSEIDWNFDKGFDIPAEKFWGDMGREFWANLDWTPEGKDLLRGIEKIFGAHNVALLSSPIQTDGCRDGKADWVRRHIPQYEDRLMTGRNKFLFAGPTKVLVDDHDKNLTQFCLGGGRTVRVPRPWNGQKADTGQDGTFRVGELLCEIRNVHYSIKSAGK